MDLGGRGCTSPINGTCLEEGIGFGGSVEMVLATLFRNAEALVDPIDDASMPGVRILGWEDVVVAEQVDFFSEGLFYLAGIRDGAIDAGERNGRVAVSECHALGVKGEDGVFGAQLLFGFVVGGMALFFAGRGAIVDIVAEDFAYERRGFEKGAREGEGLWHHRRQEGLATTRRDIYGIER